MIVLLLLWRRDSMAPYVQKPHCYEQKNYHDAAYRIETFAPTLDRLFVSIQRRASAGRVQSVQEQNDYHKASSQTCDSTSQSKSWLVIGVFEKVIKFLHTL